MPPIDDAVQQLQAEIRRLRSEAQRMTAAQVATLEELDALRADYARLRELVEALAVEIPGRDARVALHNRARELLGEQG